MNFEWNGTFVGNAADFNDPPEVAALTVRGKWKGKHFNVYMRQGDRHSKTWVENVLFEDKLYTITHKWHTDTAKIRPILGVCIRNTIYNPADPSIPLPINVKGLNLLLNSSRFVGLEKIGGKPMNHFRTTCLATAGLPGFPFLQPFKVFSDIYVPPGRSHPWTKWLQYGDGVGPDSQEDEWFLFDEWNDDPADIKLPWQCRDPKKTFEVQQTSCTNLIPESTEQ